MEFYRSIRRLGAALPLACFLAAPCAAGGTGAYAGELLSRTGQVLSAPARVRPADAPWLAGAAAGGLLLYSADGGIRRAFLRSRSGLNDTLSDILERFGDGGVALGITGAYWGVSSLLGEKREARTAALCVQSFAAANAAGTLVKAAAGRSRPYADRGKGVFRPFELKTSYTSFPSGHTTTAFSLASVVAYRHESGWVKAAAYGLASGTALQRIYADKHWASDVFAAALLGTATGRWIASMDAAGRSASLLPFVPGGGPGLSAAVPF